MPSAIIPRMNRATILGVSLSVAIGLAACSGDSGSPTSPSASLSGGATTISGTALAEAGEIGTNSDPVVEFDDDCGTIGTGESEEEEEEEESNEEEGERVPLCHVTGNGTYRPITVNISAVPAHMAHGDGEPGAIVPNSDCRFNRSMQQCQRVYPPGFDSRVSCVAAC